MIVGNIIKTAVEVKDWLITENKPCEAQYEILRKLLEKATTTAFGKAYDFQSMLNESNQQMVARYQQKVPIFDYHQMYDQWWKETLAGKSDITWPGETKFFARSSGTTGDKSKFIPVTSDMIETIRETGVKQATSLANFDLPPVFYEKGVLMLGSSTDLTYRNGHYEGEISGISAHHIPGWFKSFYKPGEEIAQIDDWDERLAKIVKAAPDWEISALSGIPSWIELMLKAVIEEYDLKTIHDLWPDLMVYTSGGVAFEPYEKSFNALLGKPIHVIDTYLASEGFIAYQSRPGTSSMQLDYDNGIFFEFVPFEEQYIDESGIPYADAPVHTLMDVEENKDYVLLISTVAGAWRYVIGDTVAFTDKSRAEIRITGRTKHFLNVVGSQLSVSKMNDCMMHLEKKTGISFPEFTVSAVLENDEYIHQWYLGYNDTLPDGLSENEIAKCMDDFFRQVNNNYDVARGKALKDIRVKLVPVDTFYAWTEKQKKKGGQIKFKRVMKAEEFEAWEDFSAAKTHVQN